MLTGLKNETMVVLGIAVAVLVMGYYVKKKAEDAAADVKDTAIELWDAATDTVSKAATAVTDTVIAAPALGIGDALGVPRTNLTACEQAKASGSTWDASKACPAGDFLSWFVNK